MARPPRIREHVPLDDIEQEFYDTNQLKRWDMAEAGEDHRLDPAADGPDGRPNPSQRRYLARGLKQAGGKLPLFDEDGQHIHPALVRACIAHGWAEPWFGNPLKPDWLVCRLTDKGRGILGEPER